MAKKKTAIHEHQSTVDEIDFSIERHVEELGAVLLDKGLADIDELKDSYERSLQIHESIKGLEKQREKIRTSLDRQSALKEQAAQIEGQDKLYQDNFRKLIGTLGAHTYRVYRSGILDQDDFSGIFSEINKIEGEIKEKKEKIKDLSGSQEGKKLFQRFPAGTRITMVRASIRRLEKKLEGAFPKLGEELLEKNLSDKIPDEQVQSVMANLKQQEEGSAERGKELEKLQSAREREEQKLTNLCDEISPEKKIKALDDEISGKQEKLFQQNRELGQAFLLQPSLDVEVPKEVSTIIQRIEELREQKQNHESRIQVLQSELEIDDLQDDVRKKEEQISRLEKKINESKQEIETLREDLIRGTGRIQELRKIVQAREEKEEPSS